MTATERADALLTAVSRIPDDRLLESWTWRGTELNVRHSLYRMFEAFEEGAEDARNEHRASSLRAQSEAGRWDLHAVLIPLADSDLDADPSGEWTIRKVLRHVVLAQAWFAGVLRESARLTATGFAVPLELPDQIMASRQSVNKGERLPDAKGTIPEILARFDGLMDAALAAVDELERSRNLEVPIKWFDSRVTTGYFAHRQSAHLREHTIQIDKTLLILGRTPTEAQRIVRAQARALAGLLPAPAATVAAKLSEAESIAAGILS